MPFLMFINDLEVLKFFLKNVYAYIDDPVSILKQIKVKNIYQSSSSRIQKQIFSVFMPICIRKIITHINSVNKVFDNQATYKE